MAERTSFRADLIYSFIVGLFIYPLIGHWIWGPGGWLAQLGMLDFAGSTVVHLTGALIGLAGTLLLGPRKDKEFGNSHKQIRGHNIPLAALGTFVLWFGWFGFNPGSALGITDFQLVSLIVVNTDFAATTGAIIGDVPGPPVHQEVGREHGVSTAHWAVWLRSRPAAPSSRPTRR